MPVAFAQKKSKIKLLKANNLLYDKNLGADVQRIIGNTETTYFA